MDYYKKEEEEGLARELRSAYGRFAAKSAEEPRNIMPFGMHATVVTISPSIFRDRPLSLENACPAAIQGLRSMPHQTNSKPI